MFFPLTAIGIPLKKRKQVLTTSEAEHFRKCVYIYCNLFGENCPRMAVLLIYNDLFEGLAWEYLDSWPEQSSPGLTSLTCGLPPPLGACLQVEEVKLSLAWSYIPPVSLTDWSVMQRPLMLKMMHQLASSVWTVRRGPNATTCQSNVI